MNWNKLSDKRPDILQCPSGRVLVCFENHNIDGKIIYDDWGVRSIALDMNREDAQYIYWMYIPVAPFQKPFWFR